MSEAEREDRIRELLPLVRTIARRVARMVPMADLDDLVGDGCIGLLRAVDAFDPQRGVSLEHYARRLVLGSILNGIRRMDPVTERMRRTLRVARAMRYALAQEMGTMPAFASVERVTPGLGEARTEVHRRTALSLDAPLPNGERLDLDLQADPQAIVAERLDREAIRRAVDALPPRHRLIVLSHYFAGRNLRDLVAPLRISPQRVSQLHLLALARLRSSLAAHR